MSWIVLVIAGLLEVVWAIGLKYTHGFTRLILSQVRLPFRHSGTSFNVTILPYFARARQYFLCIL